jgi:hypothetical protein
VSRGEAITEPHARGRFQCSRMACVHLARHDSQRGTAERVAGGAYLARSIPGWCHEGVVEVGAEEAEEHVRDGDGADLARSLGGASPSAPVRLLS